MTTTEKPYQHWGERVVDVVDVILDPPTDTSVLTEVRTFRDDNDREVHSLSWGSQGTTIWLPFTPEVGQEVLQWGHRGLAINGVIWRYQPSTEAAMAEVNRCLGIISQNARFIVQEYQKHRHTDTPIQSFFASSARP